MKTEQMKDLLTVLLDCGYLDLRVIENCEYDFSELLEEVRDMGYEKPNLNNLAYAMFHVGTRDISSSIENRIGDLSADSESLNQEDQEELQALKQLEPFEDIESFHNYIDTSIYFSCSDEKRDIYMKYCESELDHFSQNTGFSID